MYGIQMHASIYEIKIMDTIIYLRNGQFQNVSDVNATYYGGGQVLLV
jgi:hypothetical protein